MSERWYIGVDLAWSERNTTGVAVLRGAGRDLEFLGATSVKTIGEIAAIIRLLPGDWVIGIDAPLVVRNRTGQRPSDREISRLYSRFHAGAHPTNLTLLRDRVRGDDLVRALAPEGLRILDSLAGRAPTGRLAFETYPHAGMVELFGLDRIIKYKRGSIDEKRAGLGLLCELLRRRLPRLNPPLRLNPALRTLLTTDLEPLRGGRLKAHEDTVDAVVCAYLAAFVGVWGAHKNRLLGNAQEGAVILPRLRTDLADPTDRL